MGRFLYQGVLEQVGRVWWHALAEQQTGVNETLKRSIHTDDFAQGEFGVG